MKRNMIIKPKVSESTAQNQKLTKNNVTKLLVKIINQHVKLHKIKTYVYSLTFHVHNMEFNTVITFY